MKNYLIKLISLCHDEDFSYIYDITQACAETKLINHNEFHELCRLLELKAKSICEDVREEVKNKNYGH